MKESRAPLIFAIGLLLLPLLYVGSYAALVTPSPYWWINHYRVSPELSAQFFWPLEQIDRKLRPEVWAWHDVPPKVSSFLCPSHPP